MTLSTADAIRKETDASLEAPLGPLAFYLDLKPALSDFRSDIIEGLSQPVKSLSPKYFYDEHGSQLFEKITELDAYYPTRTERSIMIDNADAIGAAIGQSVAVLEYGSGSANKIRRLLSMLKDPVAYVALDISGDHLIDAMSALARDLPDLPVGGVCADFSARVPLPADLLPRADRWVGYFPGSTLGNFAPSAAQSFLRRTSDTLGDNALMLLGVDLYKDETLLERAYDDPEGVTAEFNINILTRMKNELGAALDINAFEHAAIVNSDEKRIEMHLRARRATQIEINGRRFAFMPGETLHTENSYKFTRDGLEALLTETPWRMREIWTDEKGWFAVCLLCNTSD